MSKIISKEPINRVRLAIIGGGPASVSFLARFFEECKRLKTRLEILVFEKNKNIGPGLPYSHKQPSYILNLPKENMNPVFGKSGEFSNWFKTQYPNLKTAFPPRYIFGEYLQQLANQLKIEASNYDIKINYFTNTPILNISRVKNGKFSIQSQTGKWETDYTVFATGAMPSDAFRGLIGIPGYWHNPSDDNFFSNLKGNEAIGIIGTRLSAIDIAVRLLDQGHQGQIIMTSRTGLLPTVLATEFPAYPLKYLQLDAFPIEKPIKLENLINLFFKEISVAQGKYYNFDSIIKSYKEITPLAWLNKEIYEAEKGPRPWQQVLFANYPFVPYLWSRMRLADQKQFMAKYYSCYMAYLAAFPLINAHKIRNLLQSGQLKIMGGLNVHYQNGSYILQNESDSVKTQYLLNATGLSHNVAKEPPYQELLKRDIIPHPLGGLNVTTESLQVLNHQRKPIPGLFAVGELTKGKFLATTDIASVANQADKVATSIIEIIRTKFGKDQKPDKTLPIFFSGNRKPNFNSLDTLHVKTLIGAKRY